MAMHGSAERAEWAGAEPSASFPLTRRQSLFWLDHTLFPNAPYHQMVLLVRFAGDFDPARFLQAYQRSVLALEPFRLVFVEERGRPCQKLLAAPDLTLERVDLRERPAELDRYVGERCTRRLDIARRCFDSALIELGSEGWAFFLCQHHIISDGISVTHFLRDLAERYAGREPPLRPSYLRYVAAEQAYRASARAERDARYYARKLAKGSPALKLYGRAHRGRSVEVDRTYHDCGTARWMRLSEVIRDPRIEFMNAPMSRLVALATVLFAYLGRVTGERSLVIGTPLPNRSTDFVDTCGLLMEQAFLAVTLDDGETFATLADKVRRELAGALRHGRHCASDRGLSYATLNLLRVPEPSFGNARVRVAIFPATASGYSPPNAVGDTRQTFGVHILGFEREETPRIGFDFHRATFEPALVERAKRHFVALLDALLADLTRPIDHVALVGEDEREHILALGRGREPQGEPDDPLLRLLRTAGERADRPAVRFEGRALSYADLVELAGGLAARLVELGVGRGARVGMCLPRGPGELVTMLAAWAVGAAYVPTDPTHPPERIRAILEDAEPAVLVTTSEVLEGLSVPSSVRVLDWELEQPFLASREPYFDLTVDGSELAYVLFTSGSTGRPKGVVVPRRAFANFLRSMAHTPGMSESDRLLAITTSGFDIAGLELHLPLWVGGTVEIADRATARDPEALARRIEREPFTMLQATPTTWRLLIEAGFRGTRRPLTMLCGGEALSEELATLLLPHGTLWNLYGPTETTVWSTVKRIESARDGITIGRPIDGTQVYVLDELGEVLPLGVAGELCIGGAGLALGYLGQPELSAERFVDSRHGALGERIYRTGDRARMREDGELEWLGRLDSQVKVRGFRIELGEVEACLRRHVEVREAVVVARGRGRERGDTDVSLAAYYVGAAEAQALREHARSYLPSYMQPTAYVRLAELPLNANGKIDRKRLPEVEEIYPLESGRPPSSDDEAEMAALFEQVLHLAGVPADRDFFELGGNSVTVLELRQRIHETFGVELPLGVLFDAPTVQRLVAKLAPSLDPLAPAFVPLRRGRADLPPLLCLMGVVLYRPLAEALDTERSVYGIHIPQRVGGNLPLPTVESIAARYADLILQRVPSGPYHLAGLCFGGIVTFEVARKLAARGHDVQTVAIIDAALPRAERKPPWERAAILLAALREEPRAVSEILRAGVERRLRRLHARAFGRAVQAAAEEPEAELDVLSPLARAMVGEYDRACRPYRGELLVFRARDRAERPWDRPKLDLGWSTLASAVSVYEVEGKHLDILRSPYVARIAAALSRSLAGLPPHAGQPARKPTNKESRMATLLDSIRPKAISAIEALKPSRMLQLSHVQHDDLTDAPIEPTWVLEGSPRARVKQLAEAGDQRIAVALWDCTAGKFNWHFGDDEFVHILVGEVTVTDADGSTRTLRPGDTAYFPKGMQSVWHVPSYVKKLAVFRQDRPPLHRRARRKLSTLLRAVRNGAERHA